MSSYIVTDLHQAYLEEVFKPQLGKPGASTPAKSTSSSDLDADGNVDSFEKKVRQFIYDVRHLMRKNNIPVERAFQIRSSKTNYGAEVIKVVKEKLGIKSGGSAPVSEEVSGHKEKLYSIIIRYKNGTSYRKRTSRSEINRLRSNPNVSSVEMTKYGVDGIAKRDYDGDGKIESGSKEHAGAVHNAIQRKIGGTPDGQDTRGKSSKKMKSYGVSEGFSNWRQDLKEVAGIGDELASRNEKQIKEKPVNNYKSKSVIINPEFKEQIEISGGYIQESFELDEEYLNETVDIATKFFYNCGLNENGVDIVIEELGEETFAEFVFELSEEYLLSEELKKSESKVKKSKAPTGTRQYSTTIARVKKQGGTKMSAKDRVASTIRKDRVKKSVEKAKETQAPSSEKSSEGKKKGIAGRIFSALKDRAVKDTELLKKTVDTAKKVGERRAAEGKAVYDALRERGKKAEQSASATRARRKATVAVGRAAQAAAPVAKKAVKATAAAAGAGAGSLKAGKSPAAAAGRAAGTFVRKMTKEELELQEKEESEQQQKLFGLALSVKRGETPRSEASAEVLKIVDTMSEKKIRDFAKTKHSGIPKKKEVTESISSISGRENTSPTTTKRQRDALEIYLRNRKEQNKMSEEMEPQTKQQIAARNLELKAEKMRVAADQQAMQQKRRQIANQEEPQTQNQSFELEGGQISETKLGYALQKLAQRRRNAGDTEGESRARTIANKQFSPESDPSKQSRRKMYKQQANQRVRNTPEVSYNQNSALWPRPQA